MIQKINQLSELILQGMAQWPGLEAVQRVPIPASTSWTPPLACLKIDVYLSAPQPPFNERFLNFPALTNVETSAARGKDRFFLQQIPVHINYRTTDQAQTLVDALVTPPYRLKDDTTYGLYRLSEGIPLLDKNGWLNSLKEKLSDLPSGFWENHYVNLSSRMEHLLADLAAAVYSADPLYFQISLAHFLECETELLFTMNRRFYCPPEEVKRQLGTLEILPSGFWGLFDSLSRDDAPLNQERKWEVARKLAENTLALE